MSEIPGRIEISARALGSCARAVTAERLAVPSKQVRVDLADEAGALAFLRSDDTGMELSDALAQLPRVFALQPDLDEVTDTDDLAEATAAADRILSRAGLRVVRLVEEDDAWPVAVVPASNAGSVAELAAALGHEAVVGG